MSSPGTFTTGDLRKYLGSARSSFIRAHRCLDELQLEKAQIAKSRLKQGGPEPDPQRFGPVTTNEVRHESLDLHEWSPPDTLDASGMVDVRRLIEDPSATERMATQALDDLETFLDMAISRLLALGANAGALDLVADNSTKVGHLTIIAQGANQIMEPWLALAHYVGHLLPSAEPRDSPTWGTNADCLRRNSLAGLNRCTDLAECANELLTQAQRP